MGSIGVKRGGKQGEKRKDCERTKELAKDKGIGDGGISDGGKVELGARDGEAMKIGVRSVSSEAMKMGVRAVSEVREGEVRRRSVHHDHAWVCEGEVRRRSVRHDQFDCANSDVVFPEQVINIAKRAFFFSYRAQGTRACLLTVALLRPTN
ncbi:hypothetical protein CFP56_032691 [Quercus suber]|uniref:Uncharacterized protein n=1 Tax=Quercus suber TaxID=58331 RepID=A0AAW0JFY0_QUESU